MQMKVRWIEERAQAVTGIRKICSHNYMKHSFKNVGLAFDRVERLSQVLPYSTCTQALIRECACVGLTAIVKPCTLSINVSGACPSPTLHITVQKCNHSAPLKHIFSFANPH